VSSPLRPRGDEVHQPTGGETVPAVRVETLWIAVRTRVRKYPDGVGSEPGADERRDFRGRVEFPFLPDSQLDDMMSAIQWMFIKHKAKEVAPFLPFEDPMAPRGEKAD